MLRVLAVLAATALAIGLCSSAQADPTAPASNDFGNEGQQTTSVASGITPEAAAGAISVKVTTSGSTVEGASFSTSTARSIPALCWYVQKETGQAYFAFWNGPAREVQTLNSFASQGRTHAGNELYKDDTAGHWYEVTCRSDAPADQVAAYSLSHPAKYVEDKDPASIPDAVDPAVLARTAFEAMELPKGEIHWNPSLPGSGATVVNMDTWVWIEDAPTTVSVTAQVLPAGTSATVAATLHLLTLTAPGADSATCPDTGVAWTKGATETSCKIVFYRSSANQSLKPGNSLPTSTLTATGSWTASWESSLAPGTWTALSAQDIKTTAEVPVAEIQSLVTSSS